MRDGGNIFTRLMKEDGVMIGIITSPYWTVLSSSTYPEFSGYTALTAPTMTPAHNTSELLLGNNSAMLQRTWLSDYQIPPSQKGHKANLQIQASIQAQRNKTQTLSKSSRKHGVSTYQDTVFFEHYNACYCLILTPLWIHYNLCPSCSVSPF